MTNAPAGTPEEQALIEQAKQKLQTVPGWTEPEAHGWLIATAMHRRERLSVFAAVVLRCRSTRRKLRSLRYPSIDPPPA